MGGTEQHGPSGPLGTDLIVAEELANELGQERTALVAPSIPFGVSQPHAAFPGTVSLQPATVLAVVTDAIGSLAQQGFRRFLLVNGHHGSKPILMAACAQVHAAIPDSRCLYPRAVIDLPPMERFEPVPEPVTWTAADFRQRYPDGRVGSDPGLSSGAAGDQIFAAASRGLVEVHRRLVEDP